eukprot:8583979-Pyramimonas_sp.AAC.1
MSLNWARRSGSCSLRLSGVGDPLCCALGAALQAKEAHAGKWSSAFRIIQHGRCRPQLKPEK